MNWNESDGQNRDKDPWGNGGKSNRPPDLDEVLKKIQGKLRGVFSTKSGSGGGRQGKPTKGFSAFWPIVIAAIIVWAISGIFIVAPAEQAAVLRFGKYVDTVGPGPHWIPRFIKSKQIVNVKMIHNYSYSSEMLNMDENIVSVSLEVQYVVDNLEDYLFKVTDPIQSLQEATASSLRQVVGHTTLDDVLTTGREQLRTDVQGLLEDRLNEYQTGIQVTTVALQQARAPEEVRAAFDDAIKAQEDEQRFINEAQAYSARVEPVAQGQAKRILEEAQAYKQQAILNAQGDTARFLALLSQYKLAPDVTRNRLYIDAIETVLGKSSKILLSTDGSNNLLYLPLDRMLAGATQQTDNAGPPMASDQMRFPGLGPMTTSQSNSRQGRESYQGRGEAQ